MPGVTDTLDEDGGALLSIGMFAREVRLAVSAVRFYDDCGLLPPAFVDPSSGYRYYRFDQVDRGRIIRELRAAEMSIAQIRAVLDATADEASTMLANHDASLEQRLVDARQRLASVAAALTRTESSMPTTCALTTHEFALAVRQVARFAAAPGTAPDPDVRSIEGVLVTVEHGALRLVATDRYRLAIRELVPASIDGPDARVVVEVADLEAASTAGADEVRVALDDASLAVASGSSSTDVRILPSAVFPPYERLLPDAATLVHRALVPAAGLQALLEPLVERGLAVLHLDGEVAVGAVGEPPDAVDGSQATGPPVKIGINPQFVLEAAQLAVGPELLIEASSPTTPLVVRSATDGSYTCLIMPVGIEFRPHPENLTFEPDEHGRPRAWRTPPLAAQTPNAPATVALGDGALTITVHRPGSERVAAWQVINADEVRGRTITFAATVTAALEPDGSARIVVEPLESDHPGAPPGDGRAYSQPVTGSAGTQRLVASVIVPESARWVRLALSVDGVGSATFSDLAFDIA